MASKYSNFKVGVYQKEFNKLTGLSMPEKDIVQSTGLIKHIKKNHPDCLKYINYIPNIISNPDYIGVNKKVKNSVEIVKCLEDNVLVAIKLDVIEQHYYVASLYDISDYKMSKRLYSGRLKRFK